MPSTEPVLNFYDFSRGAAPRLLLGSLVTWFPSDPLAPGFGGVELFTWIFVMSQATFQKCCVDMLSRGANA